MWASKARFASHFYGSEHTKRNHAFQHSVKIEGLGPEQLQKLTEELEILLNTLQRPKTGTKVLCKKHKWRTGKRPLQNVRMVDVEGPEVRKASTKALYWKRWIGHYLVS